MKDISKLSNGRIKWVAMIITGLWLSISLAGCNNKDAPPDYKSLLKDTGRYIDDIEQKNEKLTAKLTDMMKKLKGKKGDDAGDDAVENADGDTEELMAKNQTLMEEKEALVAEIAELKAGETTGASDAAGETAMSQKLDRLTTQNSSLAEQKAVYEEELSVLRKVVKDGEETAKALDSLEKQNAELTTQKAALEEEIVNLQAEVEKGQALAGQIETLRGENEELVTLNAAIRSRMEEIQKIIAPAPEPVQDK
jgi:chromosome segregation ATPase